MADFHNLIEEIKQKITNNGNQLITGPVLQSILLDYVNELGCSFAGVIDANEPPISTDASIFYIAMEAGEYIHFDGFVVKEGQIALFVNKGTGWMKYATSLNPIPNSTDMLPLSVYGAYDKATDKYLFEIDVKQGKLYIKGNNVSIFSNAWDIHDLVKDKIVDGTVSFDDPVGAKPTDIRYVVFSPYLNKGPFRVFHYSLFSEKMKEKSSDGSFVYTSLGSFKYSYFGFKEESFVFETNIHARVVVDNVLYVNGVQTSLLEKPLEYKVSPLVVIEDLPDDSPAFTVDVVRSRLALLGHYKILTADQHAEVVFDSMTGELGKDTVFPFYKPIIPTFTSTNLSELWIWCICTANIDVIIDGKKENKNITGLYLISRSSIAQYASQKEFIYVGSISFRGDILNTSQYTGVTGGSIWMRWSLFNGKGIRTIYNNTEFLCPVTPPTPYYPDFVGRIQNFGMRIYGCDLTAENPEKTIKFHYEFTVQPLTPTEQIVIRDSETAYANIKITDIGINYARGGCSSVGYKVFGEVTMYGLERAMLFYGCRLLNIYVPCYVSGEFGYLTLEKDYHIASFEPILERSLFPSEIMDKEMGFKFPALPSNWDWEHSKDKSVLHHVYDYDSCYDLPYPIVGETTYTEKWCAHMACERDTDGIDYFFIYFKNNERIFSGGYYPLEFHFKWGFYGQKGNKDVAGEHGSNWLGEKDDGFSNYEQDVTWHVSSLPVVKIDKCGRFPEKLKVCRRDQIFRKGERFAGFVIFLKTIKMHMLGLIYSYEQSAPFTPTDFDVQWNYFGKPGFTPKAFLHTMNSNWITDFWYDVTQFCDRGNNNVMHHFDLVKLNTWTAIIQDKDRPLADVVNSKMVLLWLNNTTDSSYGWGEVHVGYCMTNNTEHDVTFKLRCNQKGGDNKDEKQFVQIPPKSSWLYPLPNEYELKFMTPYKGDHQKMTWLTHYHSIGERYQFRGPIQLFDLTTGRWLGGGKHYPLQYENTEENIKESIELNKLEPDAPKPPPDKNPPPKTRSVAVERAKTSTVYLDAYMKRQVPPSFDEEELARFEEHRMMKLKKQLPRRSMLRSAYDREDDIFEVTDSQASVNPALFWCDFIHFLRQHFLYDRHSMRLTSRALRIGVRDKHKSSLHMFYLYPFPLDLPQNGYHSVSNISISENSFGDDVPFLISSPDKYVDKKHKGMGGSGGKIDTNSYLKFSVFSTYGCSYLGAPEKEHYASFDAKLGQHLPSFNSKYCCFNYIFFHFYVLEDKYSPTPKTFNVHLGTYLSADNFADSKGYQYDPQGHISKGTLPHYPPIFSVIPYSVTTEQFKVKIPTIYLKGCRLRAKVYVQVMSGLDPSVIGQWHVFSVRFIAKVQLMGNILQTVVAAFLTTLLGYGIEQLAVFLMELRAAGWSLAEMYESRAIASTMIRLDDLTSLESPVASDVVAGELEETTNELAVGRFTNQSNNTFLRRLWNNIRSFGRRNPTGAFARGTPAANAIAEINASSSVDAGLVDLGSGPASSSRLGGIDLGDLDLNRAPSYFDRQPPIGVNVRTERPAGVWSRFRNIFARRAPTPTESDVNVETQLEDLDIDGWRSQTQTRHSHMSERQRDVWNYYHPTNPARLDTTGESREYLEAGKFVTERIPPQGINVDCSPDEWAGFIQHCEVYDQTISAIEARIYGGRTLARIRGGAITNSRTVYEEFMEYGMDVHRLCQRYYLGVDANVGTLGTGEIGSQPIPPSSARPPTVQPEPGPTPTPTPTPDAPAPAPTPRPPVRPPAGGPRRPPTRPSWDADGRDPLHPFEAPPALTEFPPIDFAPMEEQLVWDARIALEPGQTAVVEGRTVSSLDVENLTGQRQGATVHTLAEARNFTSPRVRVVSNKPRPRSLLAIDRNVGNGQGRFSEIMDRRQLPGLDDDDAREAVGQIRRDLFRGEVLTNEQKIERVRLINQRLTLHRGNFDKSVRISEADRRLQYRLTDEFQEWTNWYAQSAHNEEDMDLFANAMQRYTARQNLLADNIRAHTEYQVSVSRIISGYESRLENIGYIISYQELFDDATVANTVGTAISPTTQSSLGAAPSASADAGDVSMVDEIGWGSSAENSFNRDFITGGTDIASRRAAFQKQLENVEAGIRDEIAMRGIPKQNMPTPSDSIDARVKFMRDRELDMHAHELAPPERLNTMYRSNPDRFYLTNTDDYALASYRSQTMGRDYFDSVLPHRAKDAGLGPFDLKTLRSKIAAMAKFNSRGVSVSGDFTEAELDLALRRCAVMGNPVYIGDSNYIIMTEPSFNPMQGRVDFPLVMDPGKTTKCNVTTLIRMYYPASKTGTTPWVPPKFSSIHISGADLHLPKSDINIQGERDMSFSTRSATSDDDHPLFPPGSKDDPHNPFNKWASEPGGEDTYLSTYSKIKYYNAASVGTSPLLYMGDFPVDYVENPSEKS